ncbi:MAG: DUF680 domain-containing protein [Mesorhizobium sp.]|nr:DUF680 domain-containing protein [Mesorhizobium sp.]MBN9244618.1 DUF680 domain-containing protein [Mesorhizobium sp.]
MNKIVLTAAAALLVSAGAAFAGSDHFGSNGANQSAVTSVDSSYTASIHSTAAQDNGNHAQKQVTDGAPRLGGNS